MSLCVLLARTAANKQTVAHEMLHACFKDTACEKKERNMFSGNLHVFAVFLFHSLFGGKSGKLASFLDVVLLQKGHLTSLLLVTNIIWLDFCFSIELQ